MAFDRELVQFSEDDLVAGESLDEIIEVALNSRDEEGNFDFTSLFSQLPNLQVVLGYMLEGDAREEVADRLFDLGVMLKRDNIDFSDYYGEEDEEEVE